MQKAPECPPSGPLDEVRVSCAAPALVFDSMAGAILQANAAGWEALGMDGRCAHPPVALDCARPAVQRLREMAADARSRIERATLTFWTPRGCVRFACEVSLADDQGTLCLVRMLDAGPSLQPAEPAPCDRTPAPSQTKDEAADAMPDVALRAKLAHELRTPLGAVVAYAEILKEEHFGPLASDRYQGYARNIYESARHAMGVVDSMLKGEAEASDAPQLTFADVDPAGIVESCLAVAQPLAEQAGVILSAEVPAGLPRVVADAVSVRQMLLNLLANAIKFARRGDRVKVTVAYHGDGPLRMSVVDTGPGMEESDHAAGTGTRRRTGLKSANAGLGLGLPLTRTLAEANGAVLAIDSALGRGTCATISFGKDRLVPV